MWEITSTQTVTETVSFDEEVTKEEALERYLETEYEDIIDSEATDVSDVSVKD